MVDKMKYNQLNLSRGIIQQTALDIVEICERTDVGFISSLIIKTAFLTTELNKLITEERLAEVEEEREKRTKGA